MSTHYRYRTMKAGLPRTVIKASEGVPLLYTEIWDLEELAKIIQEHLGGEASVEQVEDELERRD